MDLSKVSTDDLKAELDKRINETGIYKIVSIAGYDGPSHYKRIHHVIENDNGNIKRLNIMDSVSDKYLSSQEPTISDDEPGYDYAWETFEEFKADYVVGKEVEIEKFEPLLRAKLLK